MKPTRTRRTRRLLAFGPALVAICITAYAASGVSVVGSASAVSTAGVSGTVATAGSSDPDVSDGSCSGETAVAGEALTAGWESNLTTTNGCLLSFWTNNATGATVSYADDHGGTTFFCLDPTPGVTPGDRDCSADNKRVENAGSGVAIANGSDLFGIALTALSGGGGVTNGTEATGTPVVNPGTGDAVWWGITSSAQDLCTTTTSNTSGSLANCTFKMGGSGEGATQGAGTYYGRAVLTISQNP
ncbi:MAG: hypothetical protein KDC46_12665 [Thermoleophilia bacterium]|nr:hypothetical protein [Thermoleophilia bacterium]